jgi:flagellar basal body P-ring protein FlgI
MKSHLPWLCCGLIVMSGCSAWDVLTVRSQSPDESDVEASSAPARLVGDLAVPFGMFPIRIEGVTLVNKLDGTGGDPAPCPQRSLLMSEMQTRGIKNPNRFLASPNTAMVLVRGVLPPGIQKGDRFDVEVRTHSRSDTTSLRGGYMFEARLREMAVLGGEFREGNVFGLAQGPVLVDPVADEEDDPILACRGRVLGGGIAMKSRQLGLVLKPGHQDVFNASRVASAVNKRFHSFHHGIKSGVANAKTDKFIELTVHPRYRNNIPRYVQVVRSIVLQESAGERLKRIEGLKTRLLDPATAELASLELEALGKDGIDVLKQGLATSDPEVRFHAAEALAYLDCTEAAKVLGETARTQPAFRVYALTALSVMHEYSAYEELRALLGANSAETRYGAFRALWTSNPADPLVLGEKLKGRFAYHVLNTTGPPMIHVTRNRRPEIVLFGEKHALATPFAMNAGNHIMVTSTPSGKVSVAKFAIGKDDQKRLVSTDVDEVIRAIVEVGGTYPDIVQMLQEAKVAGVLESRFEVDAVPEAGRDFQRRSESQVARSSEGDANPPPDSVDSVEETPRSDADSAKTSRNPKPLKSFLARMTGRE